PNAAAVPAIASAFTSSTSSIIGNWTGFGGGGGRRGASVMAVVTGNGAGPGPGDAGIAGDAFTNITIVTVNPTSAPTTPSIIVNFPKLSGAVSPAVDD